MRPELLFTLIIMCLPALSGKAQVEASYGNPDPITENRYTGVKGSAYLFDDWLPGKLYEFEGEVLKQNKINYNTHNGKVEVMDENGAITIINEILYHKVEMMEDTQTHTFANRLRPKDINYYKIIYQGDKLAFLERTTAEIDKGTSSEYNAYKQVGVFDKDTKHFILKDAQIEEVYRNKKKILEFFGSQELEQFVKQEKLKLNKDEDLVRALKYFETEIK